MIPLSSIEINPSTPPRGSVIWLHGLGADGNDFKSIVPVLNLPNDLPLRFIFPHAPMRPITLNGGYVMRAWFDLSGIGPTYPIDYEGITHSTAQIIELIENEEKRGIPSENIILAGFSQGAVIALYTAFSFIRPLRGTIALSGFLLEVDSLVKKLPMINRNIPIFLAHGKKDTLVPYVLGEMTHQELQQQKMSVTWRSYSMEHSVCEKEINDIATWIKQVFASA